MSGGRSDPRTHSGNIRDKQTVHARSENHLTVPTNTLRPQRKRKSWWVRAPMPTTECCIYGESGKWEKWEKQTSSQTERHKTHVTHFCGDVMLFTVNKTLKKIEPGLTDISPMPRECSITFGGIHLLIVTLLCGHTVDETSTRKSDHKWNVLQVCER